MRNQFVTVGTVLIQGFDARDLFQLNGWHQPRDSSSRFADGERNNIFHKIGKQARATFYFHSWRVNDLSYANYSFRAFQPKENVKKIQKHDRRI